MKSNSIVRNAGILIVDDHAISRHFIFETLRQFSDNIRQTHTGHEAVLITRNWFPELIYTDIHLPDTCGLKMVQEIRSAWPQERSLPHIVITTGDRSSRLKQRARQANVAGILFKPISMEDIKATARRLISTDCTVQESSVPGPDASMDNELRELFSRELTTRLPMLDECISKLDWQPANEILHQLIAASAMCQEKELEKCSRIMYQTIGTNPEPKTIAQAYHPFLRAAAQTKMRLGSPPPNEIGHFTDSFFQAHKD